MSMRVKRGDSDHRTGSKNLVDDFWFLDRLVSTRTIFITTRDAQHCSYPSPSSKLASSLVYGVLCAPPRDILSTQSHHEGRRTHGPRSEQQRKCRYDRDHRTAARRRKGLWVYLPMPKEVCAISRDHRIHNWRRTPQIGLYVS